jgi:antitoxin ParD1/3/4
MSYRDRTSIDPEIRGGRPCIKGIVGHQRAAENGHSGDEAVPFHQIAPGEEKRIALHDEGNLARSPRGRQGTVPGRAGAQGLGYHGGPERTSRRVNPMTVQIPPELERMVQEKVESGLYHSAAEVISEALHVLEERDQTLDARATAFKAEIEDRLASGPATPMDFSAVKERIRRELRSQETGRR